MSPSYSGETHLALLRGINVGGNNIIPMAALVKTFERMKFQSVKTFIASGNVMFKAPKQDLRKLEERIEMELEKDFNYEAKVVVKSKSEMDAIIKGIAKGWKKPSAAERYYVMFLRHAIDNKKLLDQFEPRAGVETLTYVPGALLWAAKTSGLGKSTVAKKMLAKPIYQEITVRNLNTTMKLAELMENVE
jgi:uncharacterized protein (DUF1697 family)